MPTLTRGEPGKSRFSNRNISNQAYKMVERILWSRTSFNNYRNARNENYLLMDNNNKKVLGFAFLAHPKHGAPRVSLIGTLPGKGYGKQIMLRIENNARAKKSKELRVLNAVPDARAFYEKGGFKDRQEGPYSTYGRQMVKILVSGTSLRTRRSPSPNRRSVTPMSRRLKTPSPNRRSPNRRASNKT